MILSTLLPDVTNPEVKEGCIYVTRVLPSTAGKKEEKKEKGEKRARATRNKSKIDCEENEEREMGYQEEKH
jgi:hypothetical protein